MANRDGATVVNTGSFRDVPASSPVFAGLDLYPFVHNKGKRCLFVTSRNKMFDLGQIGRKVAPIASLAMRGGWLLLFR